MADTPKKIQKYDEYSVEQIIRVVAREKTARSLWDTWWQDLAHLCIPHKAQITEKVESGTKHRMSDVYDSTARESLRIFAGGMMGYLTNPASYWWRMKLKAPNQETAQIMKQKWAKKFAQDCEDAINDVFNGSNFYQELHDCYTDLGWVGTSCFYSEEDPETSVRFYNRQIKEIYFFEDERGRATKIFRVFELEAHQAYARWGQGCGEQVLKAMEDGQIEKKFDFIHCVYKREQYDSRPGPKDSKLKLYASKWIDSKAKKLMSEGGYDELPFNIVRFQKVGNEKMGYSPAMDIEPEIRGANEIKKTMLRAGAKLVDPPCEAPHDGYLLPFDFDPSAVNYRIRTLGQSEEGLKFIQTGGNLPAGETMLDKEQLAIRRGFFADLFLLLADKRNMTATEVSERVEEKMLILGPSITRIMTDLLSPIITRTFNILVAQGKIVIPKELKALKGASYEIEYVSVLAKAQKFTQVQANQLFWATVKDVASVSQDALDLFDTDYYVNMMQEILGADPRVLNDDKKVGVIRAERARLVQSQQELAMAQAQAGIIKQGAGAAKDLSAAQKPAMAGARK